MQGPNDPLVKRQVPIPLGTQRDGDFLQQREDGIVIASVVHWRV